MTSGTGPLNLNRIINVELFCRSLQASTRKVPIQRRTRAGHGKRLIWTFNQLSEGYF